MLTGSELGAAIESARIKKGVSKKKLADDFGVAPPSVQGWVKFGRIDKAKLMALIQYFSDVVDLSHWGLEANQKLLQMVPIIGGVLQATQIGMEIDQSNRDADFVSQLRDVQKKASPTSQAVISRMIGLAEDGKLDDSAWNVINDLLTELVRK